MVLLLIFKFEDPTIDTYNYFNCFIRLLNSGSDEMIEPKIIIKQDAHIVSVGCEIFSRIRSAVDRSGMK